MYTEYREWALQIPESICDCSRSQGTGTGPFSHVASLRLLGHIIELCQRECEVGEMVRAEGVVKGRSETRGAEQRGETPRECQGRKIIFFLPF